MLDNSIHNKQIIILPYLFNLIMQRAIWPGCANGKVWCQTSRHEFLASAVMLENLGTCYFSTKTLRLLERKKRRLFTFRFIIEKKNQRFLFQRFLLSWLQGNLKQVTKMCEHEYDRKDGIYIGIIFRKTMGLFSARNIYPNSYSCNIMSPMIY